LRAAIFMARSGRSMVGESGAAMRDLMLNVEP